MFRNSSVKVLFGIVLPVILLFPFKTFSYDESTTHPALTDEIVDFFNLNYPDNKLSSEEKEWVIRGAMDEDIWPRWVNHFYDPITGKGWTAEKMGRLSSSTAMALNNILLSDQPPLSAKEWAEAVNVQSKYKLFDGNRTWQRAVYELAKNGNKKEAYITLGHILHLLEDTTVPDHTRNDTHAHPLEGVTGDYGSPYEEYSKKYFRVSGSTNLPITAESLYGQNSKPLVRTSLADYFQALAIYSNNHFFSKDTINKYNLPKIIKNDEVYGYGNDDNGIFPLAYLKPVWNPEEFRIVNTYFLPSNDRDVKGDSKVLSAYFSRLSKEAILNGAGAIKLFLDEVEKVKSGEKTVEVPPKETSGITSVLATIKQVQNAYSTSVNFISSLASSLFNSLGIKIASNNLVSSQSNSELTNQPTNQNPATPASVNPPATIGPAQISSSNPPLPRPSGELPKPVQSSIIITAPQPVVEPPVPPIIQPAPPQPQPSYILAIGYSGGNNSNSTPVIDEAVIIPAEIVSSIPIADIIIPTESVATSTLSTSTVSTSTSTEPVVTSTVAVTTITEISTTTIATTTIEITTSTISVTTTIDTATTTTSTLVIVQAPPEVVINEIAWAGTASTRANDEWFELYNNTDQDIDLTDWKILVSGTLVKLTTINNKNIAAHGYYLLERKEDSVIKDIGADAIYSLSGGFNNKGEKLELFKQGGAKVDEVDASSSWFAGTTTVKYRSMERIDPTKNGSDPANWQSNQGYRPTGYSANDLHVYGSPRQSNFGYLVLESSQEDTVRTLDIKNSPYVVQYYTVPAGKTLNINPDVTVLLQIYGVLEINGSLNALGEPDKRVNFLPYPSLTAWGSLIFSNSTSTLNFVNVKKGNRITRKLQNLNGMIVATNSNLTINSAILWDSEANAIGGTDSIFNIFNTTIGASAKVMYTYGINTRGGALNLDNVSFTNLNIGVEGGGSADPHPVLKKKNMSAGNFVNVDYIAEPLSWWNAASSTSP